MAALLDEQTLRPARMIAIVYQLGAALLILTYLLTLEDL